MSRALRGCDIVASGAEYLGLAFWRVCCVYGVKLYSKVDASLASLPAAAMALPHLAADGARVEYHRLCLSRLRRLVRNIAY